MWGSAPHAAGLAHDVLGTYRLVISQNEMHLRPSGFEEFLALLKRRYRRHPGQVPDHGPAAPLTARWTTSESIPTS